LSCYGSRDLLSLKQLEHPLEDPLECVEAQGSNDASAVAMVDKDGGTMKSSSQKRTSKKVVENNKVATVVRKLLRNKKPTISVFNDEMAGMMEHQAESSEPVFPKKKVLKQKLWQKSAKEN